ncbi:hypothetical protein FMN50_20395 [Rhodobacterales bacterium]|nr:hypothetical protein FMN50_20395 [Rhodobacterales bacterium]
MTTLHTLGLTPSHLTPAARDLVLAIRNNSCAWRIRRGWSPKGQRGKGFAASTADKLIGQQLAAIAHSKGPPRLVLSAAGEEMARAILANRKAKAA